MEGPDYSHVDSLEAAGELAARGELVALHLLPPEFGGTDDPRNIVYVPPFVVGLKSGFDTETVLPLIESGTVTRYSAAPRYEGASFVPSAIDIHAHDPGDVLMTLRIWGQALAEEPPD